jgi:hypothetical protein
VRRERAESLNDLSRLPYLPVAVAIGGQQGRLGAAAAAAAAAATAPNRCQETDLESRDAPPQSVVAAEVALAQVRGGGERARRPAEMLFDDNFDDNPLCSRILAHRPLFTVTDMWGLSELGANPAPEQKSN